MHPGMVLAASGGLGRRPSWVLAATVRVLAAGGPRLSRFFVDDLFPDLLEGSPDQPRNVHLRDSDLLGDLRLRQSLEEAEGYELPLAFVEEAETRREVGTILRDLVLVLLRADRLQRIEILAVFL